MSICSFIDFASLSSHRPDSVEIDNLKSHLRTEVIGYHRETLRTCLTEDLQRIIWSSAAMLVKQESMNTRTLQSQIRRMAKEKGDKW